MFYKILSNSSEAQFVEDFAGSCDAISASACFAPCASRRKVKDFKERCSRSGCSNLLYAELIE